MRISLSGITGDSIVDGPGLRLTIFTQGCLHNCPGCHNPQTHDPSGGSWADTEDILAAAAENPLLDTEIPVRQLLEQIVSKLSIPPFLLGLNWSSTERMSTQQADILTSELEYYRRLLTPVIQQICTAFLRTIGSTAEISVEWDTINLQDETEQALARLHTAQAMQIEQNLQKN